VQWKGLVNVTAFLASFVVILKRKTENLGSKWFSVSAGTLSMHFGRITFNSSGLEK
jgi:hypothetical protein